MSNGQNLTLKANAVEGFSGDAVKKAMAILREVNSGDSVTTAKKAFSMQGGDGDMKLFATLSFEVPRNKARYVIEAFAPGYDTVFQYVDIDKVGSREFERILDDLVFYKTPKKLGEVTVTASKVKFYVRDDTIVYNADAFQLAQGSMLDVLVKQLPGVELKEGGRIYVNGKYVESLLLNGKDFFKGDKNIMLNNLGAYTVKDVAVYDKLGEKSILAGRNVGDGEFVMDVRLKREYMSGYIGNVEAGGGTSSRYLGRLFGMWYTTRSRLSLIGNINNLNDTRTPGQNDSWKATSVPGDMRTKMAGIDYNVNSNDGKAWEFSGNTSVQHTRANDIVTTNRTNFLPGGDVYDNSFMRALSHDLSVKTSNTLRLRPENKYFSISQGLTYRKNDYNSNLLSGTFNTDARELTRNLLEQIYSGEVTSFSDKTINTVLSRSLSSGHSLDVNGSFYSQIKIPLSPDLIGLAINGSYNERDYDVFKLYDIRYPSTGDRFLTSQFIDNTPDRSWNFSLAPNYEYLYSSTGSLSVTPGWGHNSSTKDSYLYELDRLGDVGVFGQLPPGYGSTLNKDQTSLSHETADRAFLRVALNESFSFSNGRRLILSINPIVTARWRRLNYIQGDISQHVSKRSTDVDFGYSHVTFMTGKSTVKLVYERNVRPIDLVRLVDVTDSRDPLNIFTGSPSLKNEATNKLSLQWMKSVNGRHRWLEVVDLRYTFLNNALANGYRYDETTGVRTYRMYNVNGNYNLRLYNSFTKAFGRRDQFDVSSYSSVDYGEAADMLASSLSEMTKSTVKNLILLQAVQLNWSIGKHKLSLNGRINWRDTRGSHAGFNSFSATTAQYGVSAQLSLPYNFGLSTDLNVYTRRGYAYKELNTSDVVWNARLSYTLKGGRWTFMLDGFDLLHQLSNVTYNVNAQGRAETFTNVLPRYGLLHIQYRFMIQPKNK